MTGACDVYDGVDFFSLQDRKKKDITSDKLDYGYIESCVDLDELKGILSLLRSGKEGRYPDLERFTEDRILSVLPAKDREKIKQMRMKVSEAEVLKAKNDLAAWTEGIHGKLEAYSVKSTLNRRHPPVRGEITKVASPEATCGDKHSKGKKAIPGTDFYAWESYDVDKALRNIDEEDTIRQAKADEQVLLQKKTKEKHIDAISQYIDLDRLPLHEREVYANQERQKGNECFRSGENELALQYYNRSILYSGTNPIVYANRAMTHLRLKNFSKAEEDCTRAIELDQTYAKAWMRRGMSRFYRGKYSEAVDDFNQVLSLTPGNREVEKLLLKTKTKWFEIDGRARDGWKKEVQKSSAPIIEPVSVKYTNQDNEYKRFEILESDEE